MLRFQSNNDVYIYKISKINDVFFIFRSIQKNLPGKSM